MSEVKKRGLPNEIDRAVASRLKTKRIQKGISQEQLGRAAGISIQQVQKYEKGTNRISCGIIKQLAAYLCVPVSYFFDVSDDTMVDKQESKNALDSYLDDKCFVKLAKHFAFVKDEKAKEICVSLIENIAKILSRVNNV